MTHYTYPLIYRYNYFKSTPRLISPHTVVLHHTAGGTVAGAEATLKQAGFGYHYIIDTEGTVIQYVPIYRKCSHAYKANTGTVGVCFVGGGKFGECNEGQFISIVELLQYLKENYPSIKYVTGHKHIDPRGIKIDPRWSGEPENGVDWDIDKKWMMFIESKTRLIFRDRLHYRRK